MTDATLNTPTIAPALNTTGVAARFFQMELSSYIRAPMAIFWTFIYPIALFFLLNAVFGGGASPSDPTLTYTDYLISGLTVMTLISSSLVGFAVVLIDQRAQGQLQNFALMPFGKAAFFAGFVGSRMVVLMVFLTGFMAVFSYAAPDATALLPAQIGALALYLLGGMFVMFGASLLLATLIRKTATAHAIANIINIPVIFLSDLFLPAVLMPEPLYAVVSKGPFFVYVNELRAIWAGTYNPGVIIAHVALMVAIGAGLMLLSGRRARWTA